VSREHRRKPSPDKPEKLQKTRGAAQKILAELPEKPSELQ